MPCPGPCDPTGEGRGPFPGKTEGPGWADHAGLQPSPTHPGPGAHTPLGSNDTDCHDDEGKEAAGADTSQHHEQGNEGLTAEAKAAFAVGSSCRNSTRVAKGLWSPAGGGPPGPPPTPVATRRQCTQPAWTGRDPGWGWGSGAGGGTCSREEQKGQTYQAKGAADQARVRLGTGGHVQPQPHHTPLVELLGRR